jgi:hypothetical protein
MRDVIDVFDMIDVIDVIDVIDMIDELDMIDVVDIFLLLNEINMYITLISRGAQRKRDLKNNEKNIRSLVRPAARSLLRKTRAGRCCPVVERSLKIVGKK